MVLSVIHLTKSVNLQCAEASVPFLQSVEGYRYFYGVTDLTESQNVRVWKGPLWVI